jgi:hypothetical protein
MIKITKQDFDKLVKLLAKDGQEGAPITFVWDHPCIRIKTMDRSNKEMIIEISDVEYPFMPRKTITETF